MLSQSTADLLHIEGLVKIELASAVNSLNRNKNVIIVMENEHHIYLMVLNTMLIYIFHDFNHAFCKIL